MARQPLLLLLAGLLWIGPAGTARAGDASGSATEPPLETRLYAVGALTAGSPRMTLDPGPYAPSSDTLDDDRPACFGNEPPQRVRLLGSAGEVVDLLTSRVGAPGTWDRPGVFLTAAGEDRLFVKASRASHDEIAEILAAASRRALVTVVVDAALLSGSVSTRVAGDAIPEAVGAGTLHLLGFGRAVVRPGGRSAARAGAQRAVLQGVDVRVAQGTRATDPFIGIVPDGFACAVEATAVSGSRATLRLWGWWSAPPTLTVHRTKEGDLLELPATNGRAFDTTVDATPGAWDVVPLSAGVFLAVRARVDAPAADPADGAGLLVRRFTPEAPLGPLVAGCVDVTPLAEQVRNTQGTPLTLRPSCWTPEEPPELAEPAPIFPVDTLVDLIRAEVVTDFDSSEGASIELRGGRLLLRHDAPRLDAVRRFVDALRAAYVTSTRVRVALVSLPLASLPELWTGLDDALVADGGEGLLRRPGARPVGDLGTGLRDGQRRALTTGRLRPYLQDFDVEIAEKSAIANPIVQEVLDGTSLDVEASPIGRGAEVALDLRLESGTVREMRDATSMHGPIQCPVYGLLRCLGSFTLRSGATRIAGASSAGGDVTLVLVTATRE